MFYNMFMDERPPMLVPDSQKGREYRRKMTRSFIGSMNTGIIERMHAKSIIAEKAYNDEVLTQEDLDSFMTDEAGNSRNRVVFDFNLMKPIIEQMRGTAIDTNYYASVQPMTRGKRTRRLYALAEQVLMHNLADRSPSLRRIIGSRYNLGSTPEQTAERFLNNYGDPWVDAMNELLKASAIHSDMDLFKGDDAMRFAFSGIHATAAYDSGTYMKFRRILPREFFYDTTARQPDLSDAMFMGHCPLMTMANIAQQWQVDKDELEHIQATIRQYGPWAYNVRGGDSTYNIMSQDKVRVFCTSWVDMMHQEWGFIEGPGGVPTKVRVGDDDGYGRTYEKKDIIAPPDTEQNRELYKGNKTVSLDVECVHTCDMIPWEYMAGVSGVGNRSIAKAFREGQLPDLVLGHGVWEHQQYVPTEVTNVKLPYQVICFANVDGEIVSPVQSVISPNRFIDRILIALEQQINMSGGRTMTIDMDMVQEGVDESDVSIRRKNGGVIPLRAGGRGVSTAMGSFDDTPAAGTYAMLQVVKEVQDMIRTVTGIHEPMNGEQQKGQLVRVTELLVQRGNIMQRAFHDAMENHKRQQYQCLATAGKEMYLDRPDVLLDMIDEDHLIPLYQTQQFRMERFNGHVERDNGDRTRRDVTNQWLDGLVQMQVIDREEYFAMYNKLDVEGALTYMRRKNEQLKQASAEAERQQQKEQMLAGLAAKEQEIAQREFDIQKDQTETANMLAKEAAKEKANSTREDQKLLGALALKEKEAQLAPAEPVAQ